MGDLMTDPFNAHEQYAAIDIDVTGLGGSDLAARLPSSWLPMAKNTPLFENAMRQRSYVVSGNRLVDESVTIWSHSQSSRAAATLQLSLRMREVLLLGQVTVLTLGSNVSAEIAAETIFPSLPTSNETAVSMTLQVATHHLAGTFRMPQMLLCPLWNAD